MWGLGLLFCCVFSVSSFGQTSKSPNVEQHITTEKSAPNYHLFVWHYDGTYDAFAFNEHPVLICTSDVLRIITNSKQIEYAEKDVHKYTISDSDKPQETAIHSVQNDKNTTAQRIERMGEEIRMYGHVPGSILQIFGTDGHLYAERRASADGIITFNLSALPIGLYVFHTKTTNYKIIKQ